MQFDGALSPSTRSLQPAMTSGPGPAAIWEDNDLLFAQTTGRTIECQSDWHAWKALLIALACVTSACTTDATPRRPFCSPRACIRAS